MSLRPPHSLRARLLWLLLVAITLTALAQALVAYRAARSEADQIFDYHMQRTAMSLRSALPRNGLDPSDPEDRDNSDFDFVVQVWADGGPSTFVSAPAALPQVATLGFSDVAARGTTYRVYAMRWRGLTIQVAQDMAARRLMAGKLALRTVGPIAVMAPLLMMVAWWVVSTSLAPVSRVRRQLAERQVDGLSEVSEAGLPEEIRPLVQELNLLFGRVRQAFDAQKNFVADAAHELRSPLAALKLQAQGLKRASDDAARELAVNRLTAGIERATRLVEQLLALARQQATAASGARAVPVVLADIALLELADAAPTAQAQGIDLGLVHADEDAIAGEADALCMLVRNLLDNAIKYTPRGGTVDLALRRTGQQLLFSIDDSGPGIAESDRERALDRFHRVGESQAPGSGLGLAIVKSIADLHGATLVLARSPRLGGLRVEVSFPGATSRDATRAAPA